MSSSFGEKVKIMIFGQSHSEAIGVVIDGLPVGRKLIWRRCGNSWSDAPPAAEMPIPHPVRRQTCPVWYRAYLKGKPAAHRFVP